MRSLGRYRILINKEKELVRQLNIVREEMKMAIEGKKTKVKK
jgi:hypothetical protein